MEADEQLFEAIHNSPSGVTFTVDDYDESWKRLKTDDGRIHLAIPEMLEMFDSLRSPAGDSGEFPFLLLAGERRSFTANTIIRDNSWRKKDADGALRVLALDAERLGLTDGGKARVTTSRASAEVTVEISPMMRSGHISLPNGFGVGTSDDHRGTAPNELTDSQHRAPIAGTPFHKHVPARLEPVAV